MRESVKYITQYIFLLLTSPLILPPPLDDITVSKKSKTSHECEKIKFYFFYRRRYRTHYYFFIYILIIIPPPPSQSFFINIK